MAGGSTKRQPWEEVEHTADWALRVWGEDRRALFENAARGMLSLAGGQADPAQPALRRSFELSAPDWETLLVDWLSELVYLIEDEGAVIDAVYVQQVDDLALRADVTGRPGREFSKHIKAVTYHNLAVQCGPDGCEATVVFDV